LYPPLYFYYSKALLDTDWCFLSFNLSLLAAGIIRLSSNFFFYFFRVAERCNDRKATAKMVGDLSSEMFLGLFIKTAGSIATRGVVLQVLDRSVDVVLLNSGLIKRVYMDVSFISSLFIFNFSISMFIPLSDFVS